MNLEPHAKAWGGVIPSGVLVEAGFSYQRLRALCASGELKRLRQGWFVAPGADPALKTAALCGGSITCVSQAQRLKLWVTTPPTELHLAMPSHGRKPARPFTLHLHWNRPVVHRDPRVLGDTIANVLTNVARCLPEEDAQATWESALKKGLITNAALRRFPLTGVARELAQVSSPFADSGLESLLVRRLKRLGLRVRVQTWIQGHHVDALIGDRLVVQVDGGTHVDAQRTSDIRHDARLLLDGYHVIRVGYVQVMECWHEVQDLILHAVAQGLAEAPRAGDLKH